MSLAVRIGGVLAAAALAWFLSGCGPSTMAVQAQAANAVAITVDDLAPLLVDQYRQEGTACVLESGSRAASSACRTKVDGAWSRVRRAWADLRMTHDDVAAKLEAHKVPGTDPDEYLKMLRVAYCELRANAPPLLKKRLPEMPLLPCPEAL